MDYSLYISIEEIDPANRSDYTENRNQFISADGTELYHIGIIDYL